ncbi:MAG: hypothetical protein H0T84_13630 [Tatlockia sp.]|nr:hypothetical protein [Tatlockia sp.]
MEMLDRILTFVFINTKAKARLFRQYSSDEEHVLQVNHAKLIYEKQIKRYLFGLGFFLSFIPGTEAFIARKELYTSLITHPASSYELADPILGALLGTITKYTYSRFGRFNFDFDEAFYKIIHGTGAKSWLLHPFNIFQYLAGMLEFMRNFFWHQYEFDSSINQLTRSFFGILLAIDFLLLVAVIFLLVIPTEFVLNAIDTLIFDPIRFIVGEIKQSYDYYDKEFLYVPTEEYNKVTMIKDALNTSAQENPLTIISANQFTLEITSSEKKNQYTTYANGFFFKTYKNDPMFLEKDYKSIAATHRTLENLERFYFFNKSSATLPNDVVKLITATSLEPEMNQIELKIQFSV